jgi:hypothetical protein
MLNRIIGIVVVVGVMSVAVPAQAQSSRERYWGASFSFVPKFEVKDTGPLKDVAQYMLTGAEESAFNIEASEFRVGFVRSSHFGGDLGVSYVQRSYAETSTQGAIEQLCPPSGTQCFIGGTLYRYQDVSLRGVEVHKSAPFVTIKERVQIGIEFAGGVGQYRGTAELVTGNETGTGTITSSVDARELNNLYDSIRIVPLARLEFAVTGILPAGLKVRGTGGLSFPGKQNISLTLIYLFEPR